MTILPRPSDWLPGTRPQEEDSRANGQGQHYFAFLSYSHKDEEIAQWLHESLEGFRVPRSLVGRMTTRGPIPQRLTPIFRDSRELAAADDLGSEIRNAISRSRFLIVLCSPAAAGSRWTNSEIEAFKAARPDAPIFAVIVAGEPWASDVAGQEDKECFPPALRFQYDRKGRRTTKKAEPLAADLRGDKAQRRKGFLTLVAGMLGLGLDDLVRRESLRAQRRQALIASGSLAGMVLTSVLAIVALQARDAASEQRQEAESLVAFMLGDLKEKLEPIGRLDALDGVGTRVLDYYSKQDTADLTDEALIQRSRALSLTAQVAYLRGNMKVAEQLYRQAMQGTGEAVARDPQDPERLYAHAQNIFWIGEIGRRTGRPDEVDAALREYKRLADQMVALEPDNLRWRMEAVYGNINMGIALRNQRRFVEAAQHFAGALRPMESLASFDPANDSYQYELANLIGWHADAQRDLGNLGTAIENRQRQIGHLRRLIAAGSTDVELRRQLIPAHQGLGVLLSSTGQPAEAIEQFRLAIAEADRLIPIEPDNFVWRGLAASVRLELARDLVENGRTAEAAPEARAGCALATLVKTRDSGASWRSLETSCHMIRAHLALQAGATGEALNLAQAALSSARKERSEDPVRERYSIAAAYRLLGDIRQQMGDGDQAKAMWGAGLAQMPAGVAERPLEMRERAALLDRLGLTAQSRRLSERLMQIGFRRHI